MEITEDSLFAFRVTEDAEQKIWSIAEIRNWWANYIEDHYKDLNDESYTAKKDADNVRKMSPEELLQDLREAGCFIDNNPGEWVALTAEEAKKLNNGAIELEDGQKTFYAWDGSYIENDFGFGPERNACIFLYESKKERDEAVAKKRNIQNIQKLAKSAFKENKIKSFKEQIIDFKLGKVPSGELLLIEDNPNKWNIEGVDFDNKIVVIKQSFINKILEDHEIDFELLVNVSNLIKDRVLSFDSISYPDSRVIILDVKDKYDRDVLVALHLDIEKNKIQVSELSSIYGKKELGFLLENTIKLNKQIEITPKTNKWLLSSGVPFPTLVTTYLQNEYNKKFNKSQDKLISHCHKNHQKSPKDRAKSASKVNTSINKNINQER